MIQFKHIQALIMEVKRNPEPQLISTIGRDSVRFPVFLSLLIACFVSFGIPSVVSAADVLIEFGTSMKYIANSSDPSVDIGWTDDGFDDSGWATGSYGVGYENSSPGGAENLLQTVVPAGAYSVYTRASFTITDVTAVNNLFLGADYDDGYIAWVNGVEVYRSAEMPAGEPDWNTNAIGHESSNGAVPNYDPLHDITAVGKPALHNGTNILAIGVWNLDAPDSSDLVLVPRLSTNETLAVTRGPYLQRGAPTEVMVRWRTNAPTDSRVSYGTAIGSLTTDADDSTVTTEHQVVLTGLSPDTQYYYSIGTTTQTLAGDDADHFFVTSPQPGTAKPTRIWVLGDSGTADANSAAVRDSYHALTGSAHTDLWVMMGDNAYPDGTDTDYQDAVFDTYPDMLKKSVLWSTRGNHELLYDFPAYDYYDIFSLPRNGEAGGMASGTEAYYSFDYGNIHFICLDSFGTDRSATGPMMTWLEQDLANTTQHWIIAFWHHPPYSKGRRDSDTETLQIDMRQNALPILEDYGVDLVLSGHSHSYERSHLIDGHYGFSTSFDPTTMLLDGGDGSPTGDGAYEKFVNEADAYRGAVFIVAGSSGKVETVGGTFDHPVMAVNHIALGSVVLDINNNELNARFIDDTGTELDNFTIVKNSCATTDEVCNGIDADCDGAVDEDFVTTASTCGVGACAGNGGQIECQAGSQLDTCDPLAGATEETCNNIDDDCDGSVDEELTQVTTCGVGACAGNMGVETCTAGVWGGDTCDPLAGANPDDASCDGIDQDCDGLVDEDCLVIYIDGNNNSGVENGTLANPYNTIQEALAVAQPGREIQVFPGTYMGSISIPQDNLSLISSDAVLTVSDGEGSGPAVEIVGRSGVIIQGFTLQNGVSDFGGGIRIHDSSNVTVASHVLIGNTANDSGGGIAVTGDSSSILIRNNVIAHNAATTAGGGIYIDSTGIGIEIINNTIAENGPGQTDVHIESGAPVIRNTIVWSNSGGAISGAGSSSATVSYSLIGDGSHDGLNNNISSDPGFANTYVSDYHLTLCSPAVDAGDPLDDVSVEPLPNGGVINLGAYGNTVEAAVSPNAGEPCDVQAFVTRFYEQCLNRAPDPAGLAYWVNSLLDGSKTGADVAWGFVFSQEFLDRNTTNEEYLDILYRAFFDRDPDSGGYNYWLSQLNGGMSREDVLDGFIYAQEFVNLCDSYGIIAFRTPRAPVEAFVTRFYQHCLNRGPDQPGLDYWVNALLDRTATGADVAWGFVFSQEFIDRNTTNEEYLTILYWAFFDREGDPGGFAYWLDQLENGTSRQDVLNGFIYAQEFVDLCDVYGITPF